MKQAYQKICSHKFIKKKDQNICIRVDLNWKVDKTTFTETKKCRLAFNNRQSLFFFFNTNFIEINLRRHVCFRRNYQLFLIIAHWSCFKKNNLFYNLNVYKISAKEHQVVHSWDVDEISVSETLFGKYLEYVPLILQNCKKQKRTKIVRFTYSYILNAQQILVTIVA